MIAHAGPADRNCRPTDSSVTARGRESTAQKPPSSVDSGFEEANPETTSFKKSGAAGATCHTEELQRLAAATRCIKSRLDAQLAEARQFVAACRADPDVWDYVSDPGRLLIQTSSGECASTEQQTQIELQVAKLRDIASDLAEDFDSPTIRLLARRVAVSMMVEDMLDRTRAGCQPTLAQGHALTRTQAMVSARVGRYLAALDSAKRLELARRQRQATRTTRNAMDDNRGSGPDQHAVSPVAHSPRRNTRAAASVVSPSFSASRNFRN